MDNLSIYNKFRSVPEEAKKTIQAGKLKGFTDINPMWRIKMLTDQFGMAGEGWKTSDVRMWTETAGGEVAAFCSLNLMVKVNGNWSDPIFGIGGSKLAGKGVGDGINDEAFKMAYTDAVSIACKNLGMAADIYFDKDRTKYNSVQEQSSPAVQARKATRTVATAAPALKSAPTTYQPMDEATYWKVIERYAKGIPTKTGGDYRTTWIATTHAGKEEIAIFDSHVASYKGAHEAVQAERRIPVQDI